MNSDEVIRTCYHHNFAAEVDVNRLTDQSGANVTGYCADIRIKCADCGHPMKFLGLPMGLDLHGAAVSANGQEARLAIYPAGESVPGMRTDAPAGFRILDKSPSINPGDDFPQDEGFTP